MKVDSTLARRVAAWFQASPNRRILAAILTVGGFSVVVKVTATVKELVVAYQFGTGDAVDAFLIAFLVPSVVVNVVAGSLTAAFTPVYIEVRETLGVPAARRVFQSASTGSAVGAYACRRTISGGKLQRGKAAAHTLAVLSAPTDHTSQRCRHNLVGAIEC